MKTKQLLTVLVAMTIALACGPFMARTEVINQCPGDLNNDGSVNRADIMIIVQNYRCEGAECIGDIDQNDVVNRADIILLSQDYRRTDCLQQSEPPGPVAEPGSLVVPEGGGTDLAVSLDSEPDGPLTVTLSYSGDSDITLSVTEVSFTAADWSTPRMVTVNAAMDLDETNGSGEITLTAGDRGAVVAVSEDDIHAGPVSGSHANRLNGLDPYNVTATCASCHRQEAEEMLNTVHYNWRGETPEAVNIDGPAGKLGGINDFCIYPDINWIGQMVNLDGEIVDGGCAKCHAGAGAKPGSLATAEEEIENIDCLICHSPSYKRTVVNVDGAFRFLPDVEAMGASVRQAAAEVQRPGRSECLRCHSKSGGGNNFKRGDLELAHVDPALATDVHMSSNGADLVCADCHASGAHKVAGRGADLRPTDNPADNLDCSNCHGLAPHNNSDYNQHTDKVHCTTCHVDSFAKSAPTDMFRDWSKPGVITASRIYEPWIEFRDNVEPEYKWFNGKSEFYIFGETVETGIRTLMAGPLGDVNDPEAKIHAFKHHLGNQPIDPSGRLLPLKIGIFFQTGNTDAAIQAGAEAVGWGYSGHGFQPTERYLGVFHEVAPAGQAATCSSCHEGGGRLDFAALGYTPKVPVSAACSSGCHGDKSNKWEFEKTHNKHVDDKRIDCLSCHQFSRR